MAPGGIVGEYGRVHKACGRAMMPVAIGMNIKASEFYCPNCHDSEPMPEPVAVYHLQNRIAQAQAAQRQGAQHN